MSDYNIFAFEKPAINFIGKRNSKFVPDKPEKLSTIIRINLFLSALGFGVTGAIFLAHRGSCSCGGGVWCWQQWPTG